MAFLDTPSENFWAQLQSPVALEFEAPVPQVLSGPVPHVPFLFALIHPIMVGFFFSETDTAFEISLDIAETTVLVRVFLRTADDGSVALVVMTRSEKDLGTREILLPILVGSRSTYWFVRNNRLHVVCTKMLNPSWNTES